MPVFFSVQLSNPSVCVIWPVFLIWLFIVFIYYRWYYPAEQEAETFPGPDVKAQTPGERSLLSGEENRAKSCSATYKRSECDVFLLLSPSKCIFLSNHVLTLKKAITNSCKIEFSFRLIPVFNCMQIRHVWQFSATGFVLAICRRCCEQTLHSKPQASSHGGQASWAGGHHWLSCEKKCCPV